MEGEDLPPEVTVNTNTFKMMAAMTQMLQESRSQPIVGVDKYLKLFQDMRPPLFKGNEGLIDRATNEPSVRRAARGLAR
ncbi:hypothetical protein M5K25_023701 [Dendrobium thyrsiflorum]|uniref:Uncharacterized protein n=1 Tax=Dendrobium thyrsiflorum TaxID=117978 RepID=A0ABD0U0C9_DENTH